MSTYNCYWCSSSGVLTEDSSSGVFVTVYASSFWHIFPGEINVIHCSQLLAPNRLFKEGIRGLVIA